MPHEESIDFILNPGHIGYYLCAHQICLKYSDTWTPCHILCGSVVLMLSDGWSGYYCQELSERQESNSGWVEFEFNGPVDTIEVLSSRSVYQTTILSLCAYTFTSNRQLLFMNLQKGGERQMISWSISASYLAPLSLSLSGTGLDMTEILLTGPFNVNANKQNSIPHLSYILKNSKFMLICLQTAG